MIEKSDLEKSNSWPLVESKKLLRDRKSFIESKNKIILQTGYGPSGLPHIGTFGEVARTSMIVNALNYLTNIETEIICTRIIGTRIIANILPKRLLGVMSRNLIFYTLLLIFIIFFMSLQHPSNTTNCL